MHRSVTATGGEPTSRGEWRDGWPVVLSAGVGYGTGGSVFLLLASLFVKPMREDLGWSVAAVTITPIVTLTWGICYPATGAIIDRFGSRIAAIAGTIGFALCAILLATLPVSAASLYGIAAMMGVFASMTAVPTYSRGVASWFRKGVGLALGLALSGSALVAIGATPITGIVIADHGWRAGFLAIAAIALTIGLPLIILFYRERNLGISVEKYDPPLAGATPGTALRDGRFWCYLFSFTLACTALGGTLAHLQALLAERGFPLAHALSFGMFYAFAMTFGKIVGGFLLDRLWPFAVAAGITGLAAVGAFGLATLDTTTPYLLVGLLLAAVAMAQGAEADFVGFFVLRSFGMRAFSTIVGMLAMIVTLGLTIGAWLYGILFDIYGSYENANYIGAGCLITAGVFVLVAGLLERTGMLQSNWLDHEPTADTYPR